MQEDMKSSHEGMKASIGNLAALLDCLHAKINEETKERERLEECVTNMSKEQRPAAKRFREDDDLSASERKQSRIDESMQTLVREPTAHPQFQLLPIQPTSWEVRQRCFDQAIEEGRRRIKNYKDFESVRDEGEEIMKFLKREDENFARMRKQGEDVCKEDRLLMTETCRNILCWYHRLTVNASISSAKMRREGGSAYLTWLERGSA